MLSLSCEIRIGGFIFRYINSLEVVEDYQTLTNTMELVLPRKVMYQDKLMNLPDTGVLMKGLPVVARIGYDNNLKTVFEGYVRSYTTSFPIVVSCEDEAFLLKQQSVKPKSWKSAKLKEVLEYIQGYTTSTAGMQVDDINLGQFHILEPVTPAKVIEEIKKTYSLFVYYWNNVLYAGRSHWDGQQDEYNFAIGWNVIDNNLEVIDEDDQKLKLTAISILDDNTKLTETVGDADGDQRTWYFRNVTSKSDLKSFAEQKLIELKYSGLKGSFTTFGHNVVKQGNIVNLNDQLDYNADMTGRYLVDKVVRSFGVDGYKQDITIGRKMI